MDKKEVYLNFPIQLLDGFMLDKHKVLEDIIYYTIYNHSLKLEFGKEIDRITASAKHYEIDLEYSRCLTIGKKLFQNIPLFSPSTGIKRELLFDFYKNEKTDFDNAWLLCLLALKSILGPNKPYCKITNLYLWSRMDGHAKSVSDIVELSEEVRKYANRYQTEKIKMELIKNWNLIHYSSHTRGFYVSFKMSLEDMIFEVEKKRESNKNELQKKILKEAKEKALERLKHTTS